MPEPNTDTLANVLFTTIQFQSPVGHESYISRAITKDEFYLWSVVLSLNTDRPRGDLHAQPKSKYEYVLIRDELVRQVRKVKGW